MEKKQLKEGREQYSIGYVLLENAIMVALFGTGWYGMLSMPIIAYGYALLAIVMLGFVLRKHVCTHCYYYDKWCHCGWGKWAARLFEKGSGNYSLGGRMAMGTWMILMGLPLPVIGVLAYLGKGNWFLFGLFIALVIVNSILHIKDCQSCKMRCVCPGSAAKKCKGCCGKM